MFLVHKKDNPACLLLHQFLLSYQNDKTDTVSLIVFQFSQLSVAIGDKFSKN